MENTESRGETVADRVRAAMAERKISGVALANLLGVRQPYLSRRLTGEVDFRVGELERIAETLNVPVTQFLPAPARAS